MIFNIVISIIVVLLVISHASWRVQSGYRIAKLEGKVYVMLNGERVDEPRP